MKTKLQWQVDFIRQAARAESLNYATKMENEVSAYFYAAMLAGDGDLLETSPWDGSSVTRFIPTESERVAFGIEPSEVVDMHEDSDGYVYTTFETPNRKEQ